MQRPTGSSPRPTTVQLPPEPPSPAAPARTGGAPPPSAPRARAASQSNGSGAPLGTRPSWSNHPLFAARVVGLRNRVMRFTPSWFSVTMGTGIVNTLLFDMPWAKAHPTFRAIGAAWLVMDILLFLFFISLTITRYILYPPFFVAMLRHETHSLFLGTIPMGFVTIVVGMARTGTEYNIPHALNATVVLWWIALVASVLTSFVVPYVMFTHHKHANDTLTASWMLPIVPPITVAAAGATFSKLLMAEGRLEYALTVLLASYVMCGVGTLIALGLMVIYFQRLAVFHLPPREVIVSTFLPVGPCGQGGYALIELGRAAVTLFPALIAKYPDREGFADLQGVGVAMFGSGILGGLLLWGLGVWWLFIAVASVSSQLFNRGIIKSFNMGWWAFTFPLGSLALLTFSLGTTFDSAFFTYVAVAFAWAVFVLWCVVAGPTVAGFLKGTLFPAPCLASLPPEYVEKVHPRGRGKGSEGAAGPAVTPAKVTVGPAGEPVLAQ